MAKNKDFNREYDVYDVNVWVTKSYKCILIKDLDTEHLKNILVLMSGKPGWREDQKPLIQQELLKRVTKHGKLIYGD